MASWISANVYISWLCTLAATYIYIYSKMYCISCCLLVLPLLSKLWNSTEQYSLSLWANFPVQTKLCQQCYLNSKFAHWVWKVHDCCWRDYSRARKFKSVFMSAALQVERRNFEICQTLCAKLAPSSYTRFYKIWSTLAQVYVGGPFSKYYIL